MDAEQPTAVENAQDRAIGESIAPEPAPDIEAAVRAEIRRLALAIQASLAEEHKALADRIRGN